MSTETLDQKVKKIAKAQYKLDTSGPSMQANADKYRRLITDLRLRRLGLNQNSPEYIEACNTVNAEMEVLNQQKSVSDSALSIFARAKHALIQGGTVV